jgi:hypothetical protein
MKANHPLVVLILAVVVGCNRDVDRTTASRVIGDHFLALAPRVLAEITFQIDINEIVRPDDFQRDVRFQVVITDTSGTDTSDVYVAHLQPSDRGWAVTRYSEELVEVMAFLQMQEAAEDYTDLVEAFYELSAVYDTWLAEIDDQQDTALEQGRYSTFGRLLDLEHYGPGRQVVIQRMDSMRVTLPLRLSWGIEQSELEDYLPVLWVALADSASVACGKVMSYARGQPSGAAFYWLDETWLTCRGRQSTYSSGQLEERSEAIRRNGYIVTR